MNKVPYLYPTIELYANLFSTALLNPGSRLHPGSHPRGLRFNTYNGLLEKLL